MTAWDSDVIHVDPNRISLRTHLETGVEVAEGGIDCDDVVVSVL